MIGYCPKCRNEMALSEHVGIQNSRGELKVQCHFICAVCNTRIWQTMTAEMFHEWQEQQNFADNLRHNLPDHPEADSPC